MRIFYSWQSDLPNGDNRNFIESALKSAAGAVSREEDVEAVVERDTQGQTGAPQIAHSILEKIEMADVFVADVTIVGRTNEGRENERRTPNPNVLAEVGYAAGVLGWERVVLVFNKAFGDVEQLPFDLRHRLAFGYALNGTDEQRVDEKGRLKSIFRSSIKAIAQASNLPPTMRQLRETAVRDRTVFRVVTPAQNLRRLRTIAGWDLSDEKETSELLVEVNQFAERLKALPRKASQFLAVVLRRSKGSPVRAYTDDLAFATELPVDAAAELVHLLEDANMLSLDQDDDNGRWFVELRGRLKPSGIAFLEELRKFARANNIAPEDLVEHLRFELLDEPS